MAKLSWEDCRIRDVVRDSKILRDALSKIDQKIDTFASKMCQELFELGPDLRNTGRRVHGTERVFPRKADEQHHSRYAGSTPSFEDNMSWFHGFKEIEDPFYWFCYKHGESDSLIDRFKRNLPVFDGFWHTEDLMTWIDAIEDFFEEMNPPETVKCKIVRYKMEGAAYYWWKQLQRERSKHGKEEIISWPRMRDLLISRFAPGYCSTKCPAEVYKGSQVIDDSSSADNCKVSKGRDDSLDSLGHDVTIDNKETQVGKANEETEKDLELETSKKDVVNNVDCLLIPTQEIPFMLSIAKGSEFGGTTVKLACPVLSILHDPLNDVWTYQLSLQNPFLQGCWWSTSVSAESTRGSLRTKQHTVEFLLLPAVLNAYYDVDVFLFDPGGNIHLSSNVGSENYLLSCSSRLNSNGFFNLLENEVMLMLIKRFSNEKDKEIVAPVISEKPNISSTPACIFVIDNGISAWDASGMVFYGHEADGILIRKIQKLIRTNVDSQVNGFTYHINDLGFVKETYTITWGLFGHRTNKPLVLMSASFVLQPRNIEQGKIPYRLTGHADLLYYVDFIPYDHVNEILIEACWTREVHFTLLYHLPMVSIPITLSFDPGGSPCSLETWDILALLVYADSLMLNVTIGTKCDERRELGGVTSSIILVFGFQWDLNRLTILSFLLYLLPSLLVIVSQAFALMSNYKEALKSSLTECSGIDFILGMPSKVMVVRMLNIKESCYSCLQDWFGNANCLHHIFLIVHFIGCVHDAPNIDLSFDPGGGTHFSKSWRSWMPSLSNCNIIFGTNITAGGDLCVKLLHLLTYVANGQTQQEAVPHVILSDVMSFLFDPGGVPNFWNYLSCNFGILLDCPVQRIDVAIERRLVKSCITARGNGKWISHTMLNVEVAKRNVLFLCLWLGNSFSLSDNGKGLHNITLYIRRVISLNYCEGVILESFSFGDLQLHTHHEMLWQNNEDLQKFFKGLDSSLIHGPLLDGSDFFEALLIGTWDGYEH